MFQQLRVLLPQNLHSSVDDLENICEEKRQLDQQSRLHKILHGWLLVHIPLSYALLLLGAVACGDGPEVLRQGDAATVTNHQETRQAH